MSIFKPSEITCKLLPTPKINPRAHLLVWDDLLDKFRPCVNEDERRLGTAPVHGKWMDNSSACRNWAFAKLILRGNFGACGVIINNTAEINNHEVRQLINCTKENISEDILEAFVNAHNDLTKKVFHVPPNSTREFQYPFLRNKKLVTYWRKIIL